MKKPREKRGFFIFIRALEIIAKTFWL